MNAKIIERGNGLPRDCDLPVYVGSADQLYRVTSCGNNIYTDGPSGNYIYAEVEECDWDDCAEADEFRAGIEIVP